MNRNHFLRRVLGLIFISLSLIPLAAQAKEPPKPLEVLLVVGGCCHDYGNQKEIISKGLEARAHVKVTVVHQGGNSTNSKIELYEKEDWAKGYDVVIHDECFADVKDKAWVDNILKPHREGTPGVVVHCAMHCYRTGADDWFEFCGVTSRRHGAHYAHAVMNRDAEHPIMKDFGGAWDNPAGELYWIEKVWPTAHPLAAGKNREKDTEEVCIWTNTYREKTRVFGTTLGHHNETVKDPAFLNVLTRGVLWACDKLNDDYLIAAKLEEVPLNIAQGKPVTASSEETNKNNLIKHATDGNSSTRWCAANGGAPQWLQIDLEKPRQLTGCRLEWESDTAFYKFLIEGSADGKEWKTLVDKSKNEDDATPDFKFDEQGLQYLRVTYLGSNTGAWGSLWEVEVYGTETVLRERQPTPASAEEAKVLKEVKVADGFSATLFASPPQVNYPVFVAAAPENVVYVSVDKNGSLDRAPNRGSVVRLEDTDGDGRADEAKKFVENVDSPRGLVWDHDRLYLMHPPHLSAFIDHDGDGVSDEQKILVKNIAFGFKDRPADHTSNGVTLGIDGWLYLAIGDFGFMEAEGTDGRKLQLRGGGVVRVRPDGTGLEMYSHGTRNILEVALDPLLNGFTRDNTNDGGGWDIRLHHFSGMEHHGYPTLFKNFSEEIVQPLADYGGGSGCGALYLDEPGFPAGFGDAIYTADWGRSWIYKHNKTANGSTFEVDQTEFLSVPRVTDLDVDANSHIYAASWKGAQFKYAGENVGYLVRVTPQGYNPPALPDYEKASGKELAQLLSDPSHRRRLEAQRALIRRNLVKELAGDLEKLAASQEANLAARVAAVFALKQGLGYESTETLARLAKAEGITEFAIRALTDRLEEVSGVPAEPILAAIDSSDPRLRRQAAVSLARLGKVEHADKLTKLLGDSDALVAHTAVAALISLGAENACLQVIDDTSAEANARAGAIRVLSALKTASVANALINRLGREVDPQRRKGLLTALCRMHWRPGVWKGNSWGTRPDTSGPYYELEAWESSAAISRTLSAAFANAEGDEKAFLLSEFGRHKLKIGSDLKTLLAEAKKNPAMLAAAISALASTDAIDAQGQEILAKAAGDKKLSADLRSQAAVTLLSIDNDLAIGPVLAALAELETAEHPFAFDRTRDALLAATQLSNRVSELAKAAAKTNGASVWADAALLTLATSSAASPEAKSLAETALAEGWKLPPRRAQILQAVGKIRLVEYAQQVADSQNHADAAVAEAARFAAEQLQPLLASIPQGPKLESLPPEQVVEDVLKSQEQNVVLGRRLFTRLDCAKCHTIYPGETPRGPYLPNVAKTYKRKELAEAVLLPSKSIAQGFVTNAFQMEDGKTHAGFVVLEAADKVVIRNNEGAEVTLPVDEIEDRVKQTISVMPEGLVKELTVTEFAALVSYLESLAK